MSSGVGEVTERLENEQSSCTYEYRLRHGGSPGDVSEEPVT